MMNVPPSTVEDSTVEQILSHLRHGIINGDYGPDSKLLPKQIAKTCGTSFIPVREALRVLESEGFVTFIHNRGAFVTPISLSDLEDLYAIRIELECEAVRRAERFDDEELARFDRLLAESQQATKKGDHGRVVELNRELHLSIYEKAGSPRRMRLIEQLWLHSARYQRLALRHRHDGADSEHRAIVDELRRRNHRGAAKALRTHLETTVQLIRQDIENEQTILAGGAIDPEGQRSA